MIATVTAIYEKGVLRPKHPLPLQQGTVLEFSLTLPNEIQTLVRFSREDAPILPSDSFAGSVAALFGAIDFVLQSSL